MKHLTMAAAFLASAVLAIGSAPAGAGDDKMHGTISAGKLAKDAKKFYGKTVTISAEVEDFLGPNMFTLDEDAILAGADVLVLVPRGVTANLSHDQKVTVVGEVRQYVETDFDRDYDWFDNGKLVNVKEKVDWKTRPVVVATSVRTDTGTDLVKISDQ
jgi:hypothetical protein